MTIALWSDNSDSVLTNPIGNDDTQGCYLEMFFFSSIVSISKCCLCRGTILQCCRRLDELDSEP